MLGAISAIWAMPTAKASMCSTIAASQANSTCWMPSGTNQLPNPVKYMAKGEKRGTVETCLGRYSTISCKALVPLAHPIVKEHRP